MAQGPVDARECVDFPCLPHEVSAGRYSHVKYGRIYSKGEKDYPVKNTP